MKGAFKKIVGIPYFESGPKTRDLIKIGYCQNNLADIVIGVP